MNESLRGVVLRTVKYNDKNAVVRVYTDTHGLLSFLLPQGQGKAARMRRALFQPLSLVEIEKFPYVVRYLKFTKKVCEGH